MKKPVKKALFKAGVLKTQSRRKRGGAGNTVTKMMLKTSAFNESKRRILSKGIGKPFLSFFFLRFKT